MHSLERQRRLRVAASQPPARRQQVVGILDHMVIESVEPDLISKCRLPDQGFCASQTSFGFSNYDGERLFVGVMLLQLQRFIGVTLEHAADDHRCFLDRFGLSGFARSPAVIFSYSMNRCSTRSRSLSNGALR